MKITDDKIPILQALEACIVKLWRGYREMSDYTARQAFESACQYYRAEARGRTPKAPALTGLDATAFNDVKAVCETLLGRGAGATDSAVKTEPVPLEKLVDCLRELERSVERHTGVDGRQGYLKFIDRYLP